MFILCFVWAIFECMSAVSPKTSMISLLVSFLKGFYVKGDLLALYVPGVHRFVR